MKRETKTSTIQARFAGFENNLPCYVKPIPNRFG